MKPEVSIIIPTYNHLEDCLKPCIESVIKYTDLTVNEIVIVANGCTDGTEDWVRSLNNPSIRLIRTDLPVGYTKATNLGIQNSYGEYVLLLNNDNVILDYPFNEWIKILKEPFVNNPKMGLTGVTKLYDSNTRRFFVIFFCAMTKRELLNKYGLLDESFSPGGGEDTEFAVRLQELGYEIESVPKKEKIQWEYASGFPIWHKAEQTVHGKTFFDWNEVFNRNTEALVKRFRKPLKYSIIIPDAIDPGTLDKCLLSIQKYTDYTELEILIVYNESNSGMVNYLNSIKDFGPYVAIVTQTQKEYNESVTLGMQKAFGEFVIVFSSRAQLLEQTRNAWINRLYDPFEKTDNGVTAIDAGEKCTIWCMMFRKRYVINSDVIFNDTVHRHIGKPYVSVGASSAFPIMFY